MLSFYLHYFVYFPTITLQWSYHYSHFPKGKKTKLKFKVEVNSVDFFFNISGNLGSFTSANGRGNNSSLVPYIYPITKLVAMCPSFPKKQCSYAFTPAVLTWWVNVCLRVESAKAVKTWDTTDAVFLDAVPAISKWMSSSTPVFKGDLLLFFGWQFINFTFSLLKYIGFWNESHWGHPDQCFLHLNAQHKISCRSY